MTMQRDRARTTRSMVDHYRVLEPGAGDTWNPLHSDFELSYRLSLSYVLTQCLRLCDIPLGDLRVLDVGCGNGRSTRAFLDLGLRPEQLVGVDLRPGAVELARRLNPAIDVRVSDVSEITEPEGSFTWVQATTVHSSIEGHASRQALVDDMTRALAPGGYLFYFDLWRANRFAGYDEIDVEQLHAGLETVWSSPVRAHQTTPRLRNRLTMIRDRGSTLAQIRHVARPRTRWAQLRHPSHRALLARKPR
ncbi:MAG TPA: class I SAM-dependent methyltransferase [Ilumatobacteraceae bacterium]|nr:class I SAM-dependent methyltransferase [Ilumatobacteraceae bacterium]